MTSTTDLTIRVARPADGWALDRLASAARPAGDVLLAETDGRPVAALSLADGGSVADPFLPTVQTLAVLRVRAAQLRAAQAGGGARARRLWPRLASGKA